MFSSYEIGVDGLEVYLDLVPKLVEFFESGFITDGSEVISLKKGVLVINVACNDG